MDTPKRRYQAARPVALAAGKLRLGRQCQDEGLVFCDNNGRPRW
jgi:hypothetical protein